MTLQDIPPLLGPGELAPHSMGSPCPVLCASHYPWASSDPCHPVRPFLRPKHCQYLVASPQNPCLPFMLQWEQGHLLSQRCSVTCLNVFRGHLELSPSPSHSLSLSACLCVSLCLCLSASVSIFLYLSISASLSPSVSLYMSVSISLCLCLFLSVSFST